MKQFKKIPGKKLIFRPWYKHPVTGEKVFPKKGRFFPMWVDENEPKPEDRENDLMDDGDA